MKSFKKPTDEALEKLGAVLLHPVQYRYFFQRLQNPEWVEPLDDRGYFSNPPPARREKDGFVSFPVWPQLDYLTRMAPKKPDEVAKALRHVLKAAAVWAQDEENQKED